LALNTNQSINQTGKLHIAQFIDRNLFGGQLIIAANTFISIFCSISRRYICKYEHSRLKI
jgi:hypothetical protein